MILFYFSMAVLAGISIVVARIINANLANRIGLFQGTIFNYLTGVLFSLIFLLFSKEMLSLGNIDWKSIPIWAYLGGIVSVAVVVLSSYVTPKISVFYQTLFVFIGQLFVGIIVDFVVLNQLSIGKVIGGILVLVGLTLNLVLDTKSLKKVG
ncbi:DMT family transporter [Vagococcus carniphilus]|uniref:DMT family transporter n=1 Tax=Vagococcus carniphilus TaxID=218144 RepID=A0AAW8U3F2_9ENTE|nr:DMT family transporter [Vagococcus carniphilus]MDT2833296.1 DMT family transporter [Vagococcus carniphilus]